MNICPNAYYNYKKRRKRKYHEEQAKILSEIENIRQKKIIHIYLKK